MPSISGIEAGFQIGPGWCIPLQTSSVAATQVSVEVLSENTADTIQCHGVNARIQEAETTTVSVKIAMMVLVL